MKYRNLFLMSLLGMGISSAAGEINVVKNGGRQLTVSFSEDARTYRSKFDFPCGDPIQVTDEHHHSVKAYRKGGTYSMTSPRKLRSMECHTPNSYLPGTLVVKNAKGLSAAVYERGKDFEIDVADSVFGRLPNGAIKENTPVYISYKYVNQRIDAVVLRDGKLQLIKGPERVNCPQMPQLQAGDKLLLTVWVYGSDQELPDRAIMVIDEEKQKLPDVSDTAERLLPKTMKKLKSGEKIRILAWGDSITNGGYLPENKRWTTFFIDELRRRYPKAEIEFFIVGWGGRNTANFFLHSAGTKYDYQKKVLGIKPDLIISEFMNDCNLPPKMIQENYPRILADFKNIGAEWIAMTPCYSSYTKDSPVDSRSYVSYLRKFCADNNIALADGSLYYGKLRYAGIPYLTTLLNSVNHPDARGMQILANSVLDLFPKQ